MKIIHLDSDDKTQFNTLQGKILRYEGMTNSMNIYKYSSWKKNCPAHEQWSNIVRCKEFSAAMSVNDLLESLKRLLKVKNLEVILRNNKFVDKIISDNPEKEYEVMIPDSKLNDYINKNAELRKLSYRTLFHKSFYEDINERFPYKELSLNQIGIPPFDVLQVETEKGLFYVELSGDSELYI